MDDNSQNSLLPQINIPDQRIDDSEMLETQSKFLNYFVYATIFCIVSYVLFHNKKKILALVLEGRRKQPSGKFTEWKIKIFLQIHFLRESTEFCRFDNFSNLVKEITFIHAWI